MNLHVTTLTELRRFLPATLLLSFLLLSPPGFALDLNRKVEFNVPAQPLASAVILFSKQADIQFLASGQKLEGIASNGVRGSFAIDDGLRTLLAGTGFDFRVIGDNTITLTAPGTAAAPEAAPQSAGPNASAQSGTTTTLQKVEVTGSRLARAGAEGAQDVKIYNRERIDQSGQSTLADFLNTLPEVSVSSIEATNLATTVMLRGLPAGSTLILINGRRVQSTTGNAGPYGFFDLNLIPLAAVDRIEVLPTGSSAVYGGDALAGVVNIVLKKDYVGTAVNVGYGAASGTSQKNASLAWGWKNDQAAISIIAGFLSQTPLFGTERSITSSQDFRQFGGPDSRYPYANPGNVYSATSANLPGLNSTFAGVPAGSTGVGLTPASFTATAGKLNLNSLIANESFILQTDRSGLFGSGHYRVSDGLEFFGEFLVSELKLLLYGLDPLLINQLVPASNAFNPFGVAVKVNYHETGVGSSNENFNDLLIRPVIGVRGNISPTWSWELAGLFSQDKGTMIHSNIANGAALTAALASSDPNAAYNPFKDGPGASPAVLSSIFGDQRIDYQGQSKSVNGFVKGTALTLPGGPLDVVFGAEYEGTSLTTNIVGTPINGSRNAESAFAEARVPLIGPAKGAGLGSEMLAIQVALREDHYSDFGTKSTTQAGLEFRPDTSLLLRSTYSTAFKPPTLFAEASAVTTFQSAVNDPQRGGQPTAITVTQGGNPNLQPTTGESSTIGAVFSPKQVPGLNISVTGWAVRLVNSIAIPTLTSLVNNEGLFPGRVVRGPPANGQPGQIISINATYINFGLTKESGFDLAADWRLRTAYGEWLPSVAATYITRFDAAAAPGSPLTDRDSRADSSGVFSPRLKATVSMGWKPVPELTATLAGRYISKYTDYDGIHSLGDIWYADGSVEYGVGKALHVQNPLFKSLKATIGATNLFNKLPSYSRYFFGFDAYNYDLLGRFVYTRLGVEF